MRPIPLGVDAVRGEMTIVKPGSPHRLATIQLRKRASTHEDALQIARAQFAEGFALMRRNDYRRAIRHTCFA